MLVKDGPVPLYHQLVQQISAEIRQGQLPPHSRIPSEMELSRRFGISRMTVRQAINQLAAGGLLYRLPGRGTFVAEQRLDTAISLLTSFNQKMRRLGLEPSSRVIHLGVEAATPETAGTTGFPVGERLIHVYRLRLANDLPMTVSRAYLRHSLCSRILSHDIAGVSMTTLLETECGLDLHRATERIEAVLPTREEAELLAISRRTPVFAVNCSVYLADDTLVRYSRAVYRGDRLAFNLEILRHRDPKDDVTQLQYSIRDCCS